MARAALQETKISVVLVKGVHIKALGFQLPFGSAEMTALFHPQAATSASGT